MEIYDYLFINNDHVAPSSKGTLDVISPATEEPFARVPLAVSADVDAAVAAARTAFDRGPFPRWTPAERAAALRRLSAAIQKRGDDLARTISRQNGTPIQASLATQVLSAVMVLETYAELADSSTWASDRTGSLGQRVTVRHMPVGVCAAIVPWNVPLYLTINKLAPALAAGCTVVVKPAPETALDPYLLADAVAEADLPPGVVNIVTAERSASEYLVQHPGIDKVSFTGSSATGARIAELCGKQIKRCTLELGGKSAAILLEDFDIAKIGEVVGAGIFNNGQACAAQTRILAPRSRYAEIVDAAATSLRAQKLGDPLDPETTVGPLVARRQRDRAEALMVTAREQGARVVCGGERPKNPGRGWFVAPTLLADVDNGMQIAQEEVFAPVLVAIPYDGEDDAVRIANDSRYGLGGGVWTPDLERGAAVASRVRTGCVTVNNGVLLDFRSPFGGFKQSGLGRELGPEGLEAYTEYQSVIFPTG